MSSSNYLRLAWLVALVATLGSLYFSEIAKFAPCVLCWYQRVFLYPQVIILAVGFIKKDSNVTYYSFPLLIIGLLISIYHNLLYYNVIPEAVGPCQAGISCTTKFIEWFGFVTIPLLSLISFVLIIALLKAYKNTVKSN